MMSRQYFRNKLSTKHLKKIKFPVPGNVHDRYRCWKVEVFCTCLSCVLLQEVYIFQFMHISWCSTWQIFLYHFLWLSLVFPFAFLNTYHVKFPSDVRQCRTVVTLLHISWRSISQISIWFTHVHPIIHANIVYNDHVEAN